MVSFFLSNDTLYLSLSLSLSLSLPLVRDTAGQERYETLTAQYYRKAQVKLAAILSVGKLIITDATLITTANLYTVLDTVYVNTCNFSIHVVIYPPHHYLFA